MVSAVDSQGFIFPHSVCAVLWIGLIVLWCKNRELWPKMWVLIEVIHLRDSVSYFTPFRVEEQLHKLKSPETSPNFQTNKPDVTIKANQVIKIYFHSIYLHLLDNSLMLNKKSTSGILKHKIVWSLLTIK